MDVAAPSFGECILNKIDSLTNHINTMMDNMKARDLALPADVIQLPDMMQYQSKTLEGL